MEERRTRIQLSISGEANYKVRGKLTPPVMVLVQEISKSGLRFVAAEVLPPDTVLEMSIKITNISDPIHVIGKVIWQRRLSSRFLLDTCINFISINAENESKLVKYIYEYARPSILSRVHIRCSLIVDVTCRPLSDPGIERTAVSGDIGVKGMRLFVEEMLNIGESLTLTFELPHCPPPLEVTGKVVWERKEGAKMLGIEFLGLSDELKQRIIAYVDSVLSKGLK